MNKRTTTEIVSVNKDTGVVNKSISTTTSKSTKFTGGNVLSIIVVVLLTITVLFSLLGKETPTFAWLLDTVASAPKIDMTWIQNVFGVNVPDWLQWLVAPVQAIAFVGTAIVQCAVFLVHFLLRLFF